MKQREVERILESTFTDYYSGMERDGRRAAAKIVKQCTEEKLELFMQFADILAKMAKAIE